MTDKRTNEAAEQGNARKDPEDWVTGDEAMTGAQRSYLKTLSEEAKAPFDDTLTKAQASQRIDELQHATGRGVHPASSAGEEDADAGAGDGDTREAIEGEERSVNRKGSPRTQGQDEHDLEQPRDGHGAEA